jgi:rhodanese-related sulfurtransferase
MTISTIRPKDLFRRMKLGHNVVLLDVRPQNEYEESHIVGAKSCPLEDFNAEAVIQRVNAPFPAPATIYLTCTTGSDSTEASQKLKRAGYEYITIIEGGNRAWQKARLPFRYIKPNSGFLGFLDINQQIEIAIGGIVIIGTLLGTLVNTSFLAISLIAGFALAYEGVFGNQFFKRILSKMSWNR